MLFCGGRAVYVKLLTNKSSGFLNLQDNKVNRQMEWLSQDLGPVSSALLMVPLTLYATAPCFTWKCPSQSNILNNHLLPKENQISACHKKAEYTMQVWGSKRGPKSSRWGLRVVGSGLRKCEVDGILAWLDISLAHSSVLSRLSSPLRQWQPTLNICLVGCHFPIKVFKKPGWSLEWQHISESSGFACS